MRTAMYRAVVWWLLIRSITWRVVCVAVVQHTEVCFASRATRLFLGIILAIALRLLYYHIQIIICFSRTMYSLQRQIKFQDISGSRSLLVPLTTAELRFCLTQFIGNSPTDKSCFCFSSEHQALFCVREKNWENLTQNAYNCLRQ